MLSKLDILAQGHPGKPLQKALSRKRIKVFVPQQNKNKTI